jgi:hypothetical protein
MTGVSVRYWRKADIAIPDVLLTVALPAQRLRNFISRL